MVLSALEHLEGTPSCGGMAELCSSRWSPRLILINNWDHNLPPQQWYIVYAPVYRPLQALQLILTSSLCNNSTRPLTLLYTVCVKKIVRDICMVPNFKSSHAVICTLSTSTILRNSLSLSPYLRHVSNVIDADVEGR